MSKSKISREQQKKERLGELRCNNNGELMKVIEYIDAKHVTVEFQDEFKETKEVTWNHFIKGNVKNPISNRIGTKKCNTDGELMTVIKYNNCDDIVIKFEDGEEVNTMWHLFKKGNIRHPKKFDNRLNSKNINIHGEEMIVIEYNNYKDVTVEFQDEFKYRKKTTWKDFESGNVRNPFRKSVFNIGIVGNKYPVKINNILTKEYSTWIHMLRRCYDEKVKKRQPSYTNVKCCEEWLYYPNFVEWLHSQENFEQWKTLYRSALDKDIIKKGNKIYCPEHCCLVPHNVNSLFTKHDSARGNFPIGVKYREDCKRYEASCSNPFSYNDMQFKLGTFSTPEDAFYFGYKPYKEQIIKEVATIEYENGNISKKCYNAMMNYKVEITD